MNKIKTFFMLSPHYTSVPFFKTFTNILNNWQISTGNPLEIKVSPYEIRIEK